MRAQYKYRSIGGGIWKGCWGETFDEKDIVDIRLGQWNGWYFIQITPKKGYVICPDYTFYQSRKEATESLEQWKELLNKGE